MTVYQQQPDGTWRKAMPIPRYGMFSMACPVCARVFYGWSTNRQIDQYEAHWLRYHQREPGVSA